MSRNIRTFFCLVLIIFATFFSVYSQDKPVKWEGLYGNKKEFLVYFPAGYISTVRGEYFLGRPFQAPLVKKQLTIARHINSVVLILEYYEGKSEDIYKSLVERENLPIEKEMKQSGFQIRHFSRSNERISQKTHYYFRKDSLYRLKTFAKSTDDKIVKGFIESVRLLDGNNFIAPNAPNNSTSTSLPNLIEKEAIRLDDSQIFASKDVDRDVLILHQEPPRLSFDMRQGINSVKVKLKVLFSSSGKVTDVEVLELTFDRFKKEVIESAKKTIFIPAEKGGKMVSVYNTLEYVFEVGQI